MSAQLPTAMTDVPMGSSPPREPEEDIEMSEETQRLDDVDMKEPSMLFEAGDQQMAADEVDSPAPAAFENKDFQMDDEEEMNFSQQPQYRSPPSVQTWDEGREVQALGHSAANENTAAAHGSLSAVDGFASAEMVKQSSATLSTNGEETEVKGSKEPGRHQHRIDSSHENVLATQDQGLGEEGEPTQAQSIERRGSHGASISTRQHLGGKEDGDEQRTRVDVEQVERENGGTPDIEVSAQQQNLADESHQHRQIKQINEVHIHRNDDCASATHASGPLRRPNFDKNRLNEVRFSNEDDGEDMELLLRKPPISLTYWSTTYRLFKPVKAIEGEDPDAPSDHPILLQHENEKLLYFGQLEHLFAALHRAFPDVDEEGSELLMKIEGQLGIEIREDSVYSRELSLYDIDRIFVGTGQEGDLQITLVDLPGLVARFNVLSRIVQERMQKKDNSTLDDDHEDAISELGTETIAEIGEDDYRLLDEEGPHLEDGAIATAYEVGADDSVDPTEVLEGAEDTGAPAQDDDESAVPLGDEGDIDGPDDGVNELPEGEGVDLISEGGDAFDETTFYDATEGDELANGIDNSGPRGASSAKLLNKSAQSGDETSSTTSSSRPAPSVVSASSKPPSPKRSHEALAEAGQQSDSPDSKRARAS